jgi:predicted DNA-binding helix-hairpin-helix protein
MRESISRPRPGQNSPLLPRRSPPRLLPEASRSSSRLASCACKRYRTDEILDEKNPFLDLELDPKISWALRNIEKFPMEINKVSLEELLRIPGIGTTSALRIVRQRRMAAIHFEDLKKIGVVVKRAKYFITCCGKYCGGSDIAPETIKNEALASERIRNQLLAKEEQVQLSMFNPIVQQPAERRALIHG